MTDIDLELIRTAAVPLALGAVLLAGTGTLLAGLALALVTFWTVAHGALLDGPYIGAFLAATALGGLHAARLCVPSSVSPPDARTSEAVAPPRVGGLRELPAAWGVVPHPDRTDARRMDGGGVVVRLVPRRDLAGGRSSGDVA